MKKFDTGFGSRDILCTFARLSLSDFFTETPLKMKLLLPLFLIFLVMSCSKKSDDTPTNPATFVREITSVRITDFSVDTTWDSLPALTGSFSSPQYNLEFRDRDIFRDAADSLFIGIDKTDDVASDLQFDQAVRVPYIALEEYGPVIVSPDDSIRIASYASEQTFIAYNRLLSDSYQRFTGAISKYIFKRYYKRIRYTADIKLNMKDDKENIITLTGRLRSSKVRTTRTDMTVY
jgi:hypothetical protein